MPSIVDASMEPQSDGCASFGIPKVKTFGVGVVACAIGVLLHLPMYVRSGDHGYMMAGMPMDVSMKVGMTLILVGLPVTLVGLKPRGRMHMRHGVRADEMTALDVTRLSGAHALLLVVLSFAVIIDYMKTTSLSFIMPGVIAEYGLRTAGHPEAMAPAWLPLCGITGTVVGSYLWGWLADSIGRRSSILLAGVIFVSTSVCGAMPSFGWNMVMCFVMGIGAGGMLPITFTLISETVPRVHRGWISTLIGGNVVLAYILTAWLAADLIPLFSWRIMWFLGMPTGLLLIVLNRWIPESPRYLVAVGRPRAAAAVLRRFGAELRPSATAAPLHERRSRVSHLVRDGRGPATAALLFVAVASGVLGFGFQFWAPTNLQASGISGSGAAILLRNAVLLGLPLTALVAFSFSRLSTRWTMGALSLLTAAAVLLFALPGSTRHGSGPLLAMMVLPLAGISCLTVLLTAYSTEIFPTSLRGRGAGLTAGASKLGGVGVIALSVISPEVPSLAHTALLGGVPMALAGVLFIAWGKETRQQGLEDIQADLADVESTTIRAAR